MEEKGVDRIVDPNQLEALVCQNPIVDLGAVAVWHQSAVFDPAGELDAFQVRPERAEVHRHQINRPGV